MAKAKDYYNICKEDQLRKERDKGKVFVGFGMCICTSVYVYLCVCMCVHHVLCVRLSVCLYVCTSCVVCTFVCVSVCMRVHIGLAFFELRKVLSRHAL